MTPAKRTMDLILALLAAIVLLLPALAVTMLVRATSPGPILYWSDRVGRHNVIFKMPKFRTMLVGTPAVATHLLTDARRHLTPIGSILRRTSLDELPQLLCVFTGEMSLVGPRPALFNQDDLIAQRTELGVESLTPGITGLAQVNGRDHLTMAEKVAFDAQYLRTQSLWLDFKILAATGLKALRLDGVLH